MPASNLAIVFAPNIIKAKVETVESVMADSKPTLAAVRLMIEHAFTLWPHEEAFQEFQVRAFATNCVPRCFKRFS